MNNIILDSILQIILKVSNNKIDKFINYKDGFHIHFPHIGMSIENRYTILDNMDTNIFNDIPGINKCVVDKYIVENIGLIMYKSSKHLGSIYTLTHVYNHNLEEQDISVYDNQLPYLLNNRKEITEARLINLFIVENNEQAYLFVPHHI